MVELEGAEGLAVGSGFGVSGKPVLAEGRGVGCGSGTTGRKVGDIFMFIPGLANILNQGLKLVVVAVVGRGVGTTGRDVGYIANVGRGVGTAANVGRSVGNDAKVGRDVGVGCTTGTVGRGVGVEGTNMAPQPPQPPPKLKLGGEVGGEVLGGGVGGEVLGGKVGGEVLGGEVGGEVLGGSGVGGFVAATGRSSIRNANIVDHFLPVTNTSPVSSIKAIPLSTFPLSQQLTLFVSRAVRSR